MRKGYKNTEVGVIPSDWKVISLGDVFSFSGGYSASRDQLSNDGFCYLHYGDIHKSTRTFIDVKREYSDIPKLNIPIRAVPRKSLLDDGDVVFVDASEDDEGASRHIVVRNPDCLSYISGLHTIVSKSKDESINKTYRQYCFQTSDVKRQFLYFAVGTKVTGISKTNIAKIQITIPPTLAEQERIATALSDADALIASLEKLIAKKRNIKQGAMQRLLCPNYDLSDYYDGHDFKKSDNHKNQRNHSSDKWEMKKIGEIAEVGRGRVISHRDFAKSIHSKYPVYSSQTSKDGLMGYIDTYDFDGEYITWTTDGVNAGTVFYRNGKFNCSKCLRYNKVKER